MHKNASQGIASGMAIGIVAIIILLGIIGYGLYVSLNHPAVQDTTAMAADAMASASGQMMATSTDMTRGTTTAMKEDTASMHATASTSDSSMMR